MPFCWSRSSTFFPFCHRDQRNNPNPTTTTATHITSHLLNKWIKLSVPPTSWRPGYKYPNISINCEENVRIQFVAGMLEVSNGGIEVTSVSWWRDQSKSDCLCHVRSVVCQQVVNSIGGPQTFHTINNIRQQNAKYVS